MRRTDLQKQFVVGLIMQLRYLRSSGPSVAVQAVLLNRATQGPLIIVIFSFLSLSSL